MLFWATSQYLRYLEPRDAFERIRKVMHLNDLDLGFDVPARVGMRESEVQTPCLILDLDVLEKNIRHMGRYARNVGLKHRAHAKMHKSVDVARLQQELGEISGLCCQKVSEAEVFVSAGFKDILVSNQIRDPQKIERLVKLAKTGARILVCVDDVENIDELNRSAAAYDVTLEILVEVDCGAGRCGTRTPDEACAIAKAATMASNIEFSGIQAYNGAAQHLTTYSERATAFENVEQNLRQVIRRLAEENIVCDLVTGAGTGSFPLEAQSGLFNELQCGSYAFMDADYGRIEDADKKRLGEFEFGHALFVLCSVMSRHESTVVCDAGLKSMSMESGLPVVFDYPDCQARKVNDEHTMISDPNRHFAINDRVRLIPGHCDPTCNLHDWYVGVRNGVVETIWPVSARGRSL